MLYTLRLVHYSTVHAVQVVHIAICNTRGFHRGYNRGLTGVKQRVDRGLTRVKQGYIWVSTRG